MSNKRKSNKRIDEICSAGSSITMLVTLYLVFKYHAHWQAIVAGLAVFFVCFVGIVFFITRIIRRARINKAMVTDDYDTMSGEEFEEFCADVLRGNGYTGVEVTKASGDHGVDILANKDGLKYAIQCKRYSKPVGNKAIQEVYSGKDIYKADIAVVMSNMNFTGQAIEDAKKLRVELWGRNKIYSLQKAGGVEVENYTSQSLENIKELKDRISNTRENQPLENEGLICPKCGGNLVLRTAKKGANAGSQFYGCSNYPNCKYTRDV